MAESNVQLPPNSSGAQIRTEVGDVSNLIPVGVMQEVVTEADGAGILLGDARRQVVSVTDPTAVLILAELRRMNLLLIQIANQSVAEPMDMPPLDDPSNYMQT
jgi:hypothetical protein